MERLSNVIIVATAAGSGLMAGLFFIFSNTIMTALAQVDARAGMGVMQAINKVILNPVFLGIFLGVGLLSAILIGQAFLGRGSWLAAAGGATYLIGVIMVTMLANVPMNDALLAASPAQDSGLALWQDYLVRWTWWNHVRTIANSVAHLLLLAALLQA